MTWKTVGGIAALLAVVLGGTALRIQTALDDPEFNQESPDGLLRSDPGLLYYFVDRIVDAGGWIPDDFRDNQHVQYPDRVDLLEDFSIAEEFVIAWSWQALGGETPLHVWCVYVLAFFASLTAIGVYGLVYELSGRVTLASGAAFLFAALPANYRTIGFILIREDFSIPWVACAGWLFARALRVQGPVAFGLAAVPLAFALGSWHAMGFAVSLALFAAVLWYIRTGENFIERRGAWAWLAVLIALSLVIPVLRSKWFVLSLPMQLAGALVIARYAGERLPRWGQTIVGRLAVVVVGGAMLAGSSQVVSMATGSGAGDYQHVIDLMTAKVRYGGDLPEDPEALSFGARILWQGPFETHTVEALFGSSSSDDGWFRSMLDSELALAGLLAVLGILVALPVWWSGRGPRGLGVVAAITAATLVTAWLVQRNVALAGVTAPVLAALVLHRFGRGLAGPIAIAVVVGIQAIPFAQYLEDHRISWYAIPARQTEISKLVQWIRSNRDQVPADAAIGSDYVNSTAVLARTGNPILLQPKYETQEARRRAEDFLTAVLRGTAEDIRRMLTRYDCRYLLIERGTLWAGSKYLVGYSQDAPIPTQAVIAQLLSSDRTILEGIPGFRLLYRSPRRPDLFRLYEIEPLEE